ncbi:MAG: triose-phosphate isomerase family protein [bacterium]|nr:triose-phosphate isomerase family protein [bacterium]MDZ4205725.1 triose-phosphate isomerase family protein [Patescibacteria group bacterium]
MAKYILVANWKNHPDSLLEAKVLLRQIAKSAKLYKKLSLFIAPPFTYFESVSERIGNFGQLASQNISSLPPGNYTGQVTPDILKSFGIRLAIIGHSERRRFGETSEHIAKKVKTALRSGITPLVCIGEISRDQDGEHFEFLRDELKASLAGLSRQSAGSVAIAYEPVWAIGRHARDATTSTDLSQTVIFIKKVLTDMFSRAIAEHIPILYGGSVESANALALLNKTGIKGFLVGHASLNAKSFRNIAESLIKK